jgi:Uma2 family endonuclease
MSTTHLSAQLLKRPDLPLVIQQIETSLQDEAARRRAFWNWLDEDKKAEFINGKIILHSPVKSRHLAVSDKLSCLILPFVRLRRLGRVMIEKALISLTRNDYEPDLSFFSRERAEAFNDDQMLFPAPDFVVEILSKSTAKTDRGLKRADYAAHGVREYWIIDPTHQTVEQYLRVGNDTEFLPPARFSIDQAVTSTTVEGFSIPVAALFDDAVCAETLQELLAAG